MKKKAALAFAAGAMLLLILDSRQGMLSAGQGVEICVKTVVPSLFPFFVLSIYLTGAMEPGSFTAPLERLFRCPGCGGILLTGLLGGYPVGAQAACQAYQSRAISKEQAQRLLWFCSQAGPSFLFGMAAAQFPVGKYGWLLWGVQLLSAWSVSALVPGMQTQGTGIKNTPLTLAQAMKRAISAMASVCGWVVLFRVVIGFCQRWFLWLLPQWTQILLCGLLEITNGCLMLQAVENIAVRFLLGVVMLNFGGLCVLMQTLSVTPGLDIRHYVRGKLLQTLCALGWGVCFLGYPWGLIPMGGLFLLRRAGKRRKSSSIPAPVGV